jgi:hypothetical protein
MSHHQQALMMMGNAAYNNFNLGRQFEQIYSITKPREHAKTTIFGTAPNRPRNNKF